MDVLRLDRQRDRARLAVDARELRFDRVAFLEDGTRVFDAVTCQLGGAQVALDAARQVDDRALGVDFADGTDHDAALRVLRDERRERGLRHLLDAERDALALRIDRQHHGFDRLALLVAAHRFFARDVPGDVGEVHKTVDAARQTNEDTEIGDRLDLARDAIVAVVVLRELLPRVRLALLQAQRNTTTLLVDVENHDLGLLTDVHDLGRVDVLVRPVHFRDVHEAFDALFDLDEAAVVGNVRDLAPDTGVGRVATGNVLPRIGTELLDAERDALTLTVELQDANVDLVAHLDHFRRMLDALPRHVGDVQKTVDAAEVHERTVVGEVLDGTLDDGAFLQVVEQLRTLRAVFLFDDRTTRDDDVVALLVELDDLELEDLAFEVGRIADRTDVDERTGKERADILDLDRETTLHAAIDDAGDDLLIIERLFETRPGAGTLGLLARQAGLTRAVFHGVQRHFDFVAGLALDLATLILELVDRDDGFRLQPGIDDDVVLADLDDKRHEDLAWTKRLVRQALFEHLRKRFSHV